jgi:hypothetical protein
MSTGGATVSAIAAGIIWPHDCSVARSHVHANVMAVVQGVVDVALDLKRVGQHVRGQKRDYEKPASQVAWRVRAETVTGGRARRVPTRGVSIHQVLLLPAIFARLLSTRPCLRGSNRSWRRYVTQAPSECREQEREAPSARG